MTKQSTLEDKLTKTVNEPFPLKTLVKTEASSALSPSKTKGIRYYVSQDAIKHGFKNCPIKSLNAKRFEELIMAYVIRFARIYRTICAEQISTVRKRGLVNIKNTHLRS